MIYNVRPSDLDWANMQSPAVPETISRHVRFEVFTAVTMENMVFWDVMQCGSCKSRCFGGTYRLHHEGDKNR
jgi:hypothetical protein